MSNIVCFHLYNNSSGSPKVQESVLGSLAGKGYGISLVTSKGGVPDIANYQCMSHAVNPYGNGKA